MLEGKIVKKRGDFIVDISFCCNNGELLVLTGPSGAGKTTIIRMLAGLERPDRGRIACEKIVWFDSVKNISVPVQNRQVGYVFQEHTLFPHLNIENNVNFSCSNRSRVKKLLDIMGILHLGKRRPNQVSGGERQRAAIAQALASDPEVLLLDEPFSALDRITRFRLQKQLKVLKGQLDIPIIMVTHDNEEARFLADNIITLPGVNLQSTEAVAKEKFFSNGLSFSPVN